MIRHIAHIDQIATILLSVGVFSLLGCSRILLHHALPQRVALSGFIRWVFNQEIVTSRADGLTMLIQFTLEVRQAVITI